jgi:hypothetical protein
MSETTSERTMEGQSCIRVSHDDVTKGLLNLDPNILPGLCVGTNDVHGVNGQSRRKRI